MTPTSCKPLPDGQPAPVPRKGKTWIHITAATEEELLFRLKRFDIHGLTIEDMLNPQTRIKLESFPNYTFFTFRGMHFERNHIFSKNFHFITLKNILITVADEFRFNIFDLIKNWNHRKHLLVQGPEFIIHHILDVETDHTLNIIFQIEQQVDAFEMHAMDDDGKFNINIVFELRGNLHHIKRVINHHKEILDRLEEMKIKFYSAESHAFFRDVQDHQLRVLETADSLIQSLSLALDVHLTISSRRASDIMRILTVITSILLPMTFITGFYGMNFRNIPFLNDPYGYVISLFIMALLGGGMLLLFRLKRWL